MEEFVQEFKRAARYKGRLLVEEFKREMNGAIWRKLMEAKSQPGSIEQWYKKETALDKNWRESRRKEKRMREKKEVGRGVQKQEKQILSQPLVWQRRQISSQQATTEPAPIEGVEQTNAVVVRRQGQRQGQGVGVPPRQNPYIMEVD